MNVHLDINVILALFTALGSTTAIVFFGGRQVGKVEAAITELSKLKEELAQLKEWLKDIPLIKTDIEILKNMYEHQRSDFKQLRSRFDKSEDEQTNMRVKMASQHNE